MPVYEFRCNAQMGPEAGPEMGDLAQKLERGASLDDDFDMHDAHDHGGDDF
jgi:hypothetical protein